MRPKMTKKILVVGMGSMGSRHLRIARENFPTDEIRVLGHRDSNPIPEFSDGYMTTIEEAIQFAPEIAIIANPSILHIPIAQALAQTGTHLLMEKPLSDSLEGVQELIDTCKEYKCILLLGYNLRYLHSLQEFRELLHKGIIGEILSVRCEVGQYLPTWRPETDYRQGVSARKELGGGVLLELSHELDYLRWIFGDVDWVRATLTRQSLLEINVEDSAHLTLGFLSRTSQGELIGTLSMDFIRHDQTRVCTAIGSKGSLKWDGMAGEVSVFQEGASSWTKLFTHSPLKNETYNAEWREFKNCISTGAAPSVTGQDGLRVLEIIESVRRSAGTGIQVNVSQLQQTNRTKI
jgi:predicted dehydrogenase